MKDILLELERLGIPYEINNNPSEELLEKLKNNIQKREEESNFIRKLYSEGGIEKIKEYYKNK